MTAYESSLAWLYALEAAKGMDFKLERVEAALQAFGNPQRRYPVLHVAGTNGKGSVAAMAHAVAQAAGYRAGLYTSPHLVRFAERVRVGDEEIADDDVVALVRQIRAQTEPRGIQLTFFEFTTVLALLYFAAREVSLAVIEVGLGGRLDATNVVDPAVAAITTVGLDHQEYLGTTIAAVAAEKGGIIKPGRPTVLGRLRPEARAVIGAIAAQRGSRLYELERDFEVDAEGVDADAGSSYRGNRWQLSGLRVGLRGAHQRDNAAVALAMLEQLEMPMPEPAIRSGLAGVRWPGRLEVVAGAPLLIVDGAHNPDGIETLVREVQPLLRGRGRLWLLFGVMRDKDWTAMVEAVAPLAGAVIATSVPSPRGELPERVAAAFGPLKPTEVMVDPVTALAALRRRAQPEDVIVVTGSLFLVGAVYPHLRESEAWRVEARA